MKATIISIHSPDIDSLEGYKPPGREFAVFLQLLIGPKGGSGEESFDLQVCSPEWIKRQALPMMGRHLLIASRFDFREISSFLHSAVDQIEEDTWADVAQKLARIGKWEFEDYQP